MAAHIPMPTKEQDALLTLAQWFSPSYPLGSFAYSHGLEWAVETGDVSDIASLKDWLETILNHGSGRNDAIFLACAARAASFEDLLDIDELARAMAPSTERLQETVLQGCAFSQTTGAIWQTDVAELTLPVAVGWAAQKCDLPLGLVLEFYLYAFISNLVSVGVRLVPLGQTEGQACLAQLKPLIRQNAAVALQASLDDLGSTAVMVDIASMKHETQYTRLFRS